MNFKCNIKKSKNQIEYAAQICNGVVIEFQEREFEDDRLSLRDKQIIVDCFTRLFKHNQNITISNFNHISIWYDILLFAFKQKNKGKIKIDKIDSPLIVQNYKRYLSYLEI